MRLGRKFLVGIVVACAVAPAPLAAVQRQARDSVVYRLLPTSRLDVATGKAGILGFAGHPHTIRARGFTGRIVRYPGAPELSRVEITVPTDSLEVLTPPDTEEIRKVTEAMRTEVLDVHRYPEIRFASRTIAATATGYRIVAQLTMHGQTREIPVDVRVRTEGDTLLAAATFAVRQTAFGMRPYRGGPGGTVQVADRVQFTIDAVAVRER